MSHRVTVWRAAQLVGVARGVLQQQVRSGALAIDDGLVSTDALLRLYPQARIEDTGLFEQVSQIKAEAFGRRLRERVLPSRDVLAQRLFQQSQELAEVRRHLQRYHQLLVGLRERLQEAAQSRDDPLWPALEHELGAGLARALGSEAADVLEVMDNMLNVMSARVTLRPSGHEFSVEGHDTLLQAGLKAGLKLNYGCGNGTCGMCKVRVIEGEVARVQACDYPMSEAERQQGHILMCAHTAASGQLTLETLEARGPQDIASQQLVAQVRGIRDLAPHIRQLHLQTPRSHRLRFLAGQSVVLASAAQGNDVQATYPVASCPCDDRNLYFFIERNAENNPCGAPVDRFSQLLFDAALHPGDTVSLWGPMGEFVLTERSNPLVFVACDNGIAPIKSLIEHALAIDAAPSIALFWLATRPDGHFIANQCRAWSAALDSFEYSAFTDADTTAGAQQMTQAMRVDLFEIACDFYVSGPDAFLAEIRRHLDAAGVPAAQQFYQGD
jgi:CDP-4-dehydro-6-deoxyglucose reductase